MSDDEEGGRVEPLNLWQDREVKFDLQPAALTPCRGEQVMETLNPIDDAKEGGVFQASTGARGRFVISNIRLVWQSKSQPSVNVSIGYRCIQHVSSKASTSPLVEGMTETLLITATHSGVKYEFMFANMVPGPERRFSTAIVVHKSYVDTRQYRDLKLKLPDLMQRYELQLLPGETLRDKWKAVDNLNPRNTRDGTVYLTDIRFLWHANLDESFNVSIPWLQIQRVGVRQTPSYGWSLVLKLSAKSGGHVLGFFTEDLPGLRSAVDSLHRAYHRRPNFGVEYKPAAANRRQSVYDVFTSEQEDAGRPTTCSVLAADIPEDDEDVDMTPGEATIKPVYSYGGSQESSGRTGTDKQKGCVLS